MGVSMPQQQTGLQNRILDTALEQAEASSWERLQLHTVSTALQITLDDIRQHFLQKDDLVEAWFDRADRVMLGADRGAGFPDLPLHARLHQVISCWLDALSSHRRLTREMLAYKLEPGHVHLQALGIMRISRTVQWFREAACQDSTGMRRIFDESVLTSIYLATFARWLFDDSENGRRSKAFLDRALRRWLGSNASPDRQSCAAEALAEEQQPGH
jgi:AcrR family transcriptional regulator